MDIGKEMATALNEQFNLEVSSAYLYRAMAAHLHDESWSGFAHWMTVQAAEEDEHAEKIHRYLVSRNARVFYHAVGAQPTSWKSHLAIMEDALAHEQKVTRCIWDLADQARRLKDHASEVFLHWFIEEQVEEEDSVRAIIDKIKQVKESNVGLLHLDKYLNKREE